MPNHVIAGKTDYHHKVNVAWHITHQAHGGVTSKETNRSLMLWDSEQLEKEHQRMHEEGGEHGKEPFGSLGSQAGLNKTMKGLAKGPKEDKKETPAGHCDICGKPLKMTQERSPGVPQYHAACAEEADINHGTTFGESKARRKRRADSH